MARRTDNAAPKTFTKRSSHTSNRFFRILQIAITADPNFCFFLIPKVLSPELLRTQFFFALAHATVSAGSENFTHVRLPRANRREPS
jgi:hypothetical protein